MKQNYFWVVWIFGLTLSKAKIIHYEVTAPLSDAWEAAQDKIDELNILNTLLIIGIILFLFPIFALLLHLIAVRCKVGKNQVKIEYGKIFFRTMMFSLSTWNIIVNIVCCIILYMTFSFLKPGMKNSSEIWFSSMWLCSIVTACLMAWVSVNATKIFSFKQNVHDLEPFMHLVIL